MRSRIALTLLVLLTTCTSSPADDLAPVVRAAVERSVALLERSQSTYIENRSCYSCHHQSLPAMALAEVRERGLSSDHVTGLAQSMHTRRFFNERAKQVRTGTGIPGGAYSAGYALVGLNASQWPADQTTDDLVTYLLKTQKPDGHWPIGTHRPPLEYSDFTSTSLSLRGLDLYGAKEQSEVKQRILRARTWLEGAKVKTHEDKVFRLLGLKWSGGDAVYIKRAADGLRDEQHDDGGWGQEDGMPSDAYATGQALVALNETGLPVDSPIYRRGVQFLLRNQLEDGSWLVKSRSKPFQTYFESGFPHKEHQWISICATSWAVMALARSMDSSATVGRVSNPSRSPK